MTPIQLILITIFLDSLGIGLLVPILPDILRRFTGDAAEVALFYGYFLSAYAAIQFLAAPVLGSLSDRYGRRHVLLVSLLGAGIDYLIMAFAPTLTVLFVGRVISGLSGASMTVASSYMVDISDETSRSKNFGLIGAAWGLGFIIGPVIGGIFQYFGPSGPFLAAALMNLANFAFAWFLLPESIHPKNARPMTLASINPFLSLIKILKPSTKATYVWIYFIAYFASQVHAVNWTLYTQLKFGWTPLQVGISLAFFGITNAATQILLPRYLVPLIGEYRIFIFSLIMSSVSFILIGLSSTTWQLYGVMVLFAFSAMTFPALQSIISRDTPANEQGELQGSLISLGSLTAVLAPFVFTFIFARFSDSKAAFYYPGAAYIAAGGLCVTAALIGVPVVLKHLKAEV